jgi:hypothetical protein
LKGETESEITAAQYKALQKKNLATKTLQTEIDNECRLLQKLDEKIDHRISACLMLAKGQYIKLRYITECVFDYTVTCARK